MTADIRLATIREICRREGHGSLIDVSTQGDYRFARHMCNRGCGADIYELRYPTTGADLRQWLDKHDGPMRVTGFRVEIAPSDGAA